jgi:hypothetical protein
VDDVELVSPALFKTESTDVSADSPNSLRLASKAVSTARTSASISVFLAGILSFAQSVNASAEFRAATEARSFSRRAEDASLDSIGLRAGRRGADVRLECVAEPPPCESDDGVDPDERPFPTDLAGRLGAGASRSSSPAMPTSVNSAYRRAYVSAAPMRWGSAISATAHTGHSDETHSPDEWARVVVRRRSPPL